MQLPIIFAGPPGHRRVYRSASTTRAALATTAATIGFGALGIAGGRGGVAGWAAAAAFFVFTWRAWMMGAYPEDDALKVIGLRTRRIPWSDIEHFAVMPAGSYKFVCQVVRRHPHHPLPLLSISAGNRPNPEGKRLEIQGLVDELNRALAQWREAGGRKPAPLEGAALEQALAQTTNAYRTTRAALLGSSVVFVGLAAAVVVLLPAPATITLATVLVLCEIAWTALALRGARSKYEHALSGSADTPTS